MSDLDSVVGAIEQARDRLQRVAVGVSGYAGAGKSVLTRRLVEVVDDAVRVRGDEFLDPARIVRRSADWDGVERRRLRAEVLEPFRAGHIAAVRPLDWATGRLGAPAPLPRASVLVVDLIGLFHPDLLPWLDLAVWVEAEPAVALRRGSATARQDSTTTASGPTCGRPMMSHSNRRSHPFSTPTSAIARRPHRPSRPVT